MKYPKGSAMIIGILLGFLLGIFTGSIWLMTFSGIILGIVVELARKRHG